MEEHNELFQQFTDDPLFLKQITDSGPAITYVLDLEKNDFIYINISANDLSGNDKSYFFMQGRNIFKEIVHPNDYERTMHYIDLLSKEAHGGAQLEVRLKIRDNYYRWFRFSDYIFKRNEQGKPVRSIGVAQDIHEAKLATEESEKLNNWFNSVLENSPNGITALKAIRNNNGQVTDLEYIFANRTALNAIKKTELVGTHFCKDLPSLKQTGLFEKYVNVIETGIPWEDEVYYDDEEGVQAWLHVSVGKLDDGCIASIFDVTDRKKIEQQIIKQEQQYHSLVENTPDVISRWDSNLRLIYANSAAEIKTGVPRENLHGKTNIEMGQPEDTALPWMKKLREVFETGLPITYESPFSTPYGDADFLYRIVPERNSAGEVETVLAIARDITEIKKNERAIRDSAEVLNGIMNAPNVGISVFKVIRNNSGEIEDFQCEFVNRRTLQALGMDPAGMTFSEYGRDATEQIQYLKQAVETGEKVTYTLHFDTGIGGWFILSVAPLGNDRLVQSWEDINELKRKEEEVITLKEQLARRAQDKYKTLFNSINEGFCIIEKLEGDGPVDFRFIEANPAFTIHTGAEVEDVIGKTIREAFAQESEEWFSVYDEIINTGKEVKFERAMDSRDRILELYAFRVNDETAHRVAIVFRDITERKRAERKLKESKELMENITATIPDMISVQEYPSRKIIYFNREAYKINGFDIDEMKNLTVEGRHAFIHPDDEPGLRKFVDSLASLSNGEVATHEYRSRTKTKDWMWVRVRSKVFERDKNGNVISIVNVIQNVTARKEAEQKLQESHDLMQSIIDSSLSTIRVMNAVRNEEGVIVDFRYVLKNNSVGNYTDDDRIGKLFSQIHPELMESELFHNFKKVVETGERVDFETQIDAGDGHLKWFRAVVVKLSDGIASASEDITERKRRDLNAAFLADIQTDLSHLQDEAQIMSTVGSKIGKFLDIASCMLVEIDQELDGAKPRYLWRREGIPLSSGQFHVSNFITEQGRDLLNSGNTIIVRDVDKDPLVNNVPHRSIQALSSIKVPFTRNNEWKYLVVVNDSKPRDWRPDEVDVFKEFAYRLSTRIERTRAETMQRQLEEIHRWQLENKVQQHSEELKKTKELLQSVSDAGSNLLGAFDIVYSSDGDIEDLELLMCNKVTAALVGQNSENLSGSRYSTLFPASSKNGAFERIKNVIQTGIPADFELWYSREETDWWFRCTVSKLNNMIILNGKNITELKRAEQEQLKSQALLQHAEALIEKIASGATVGEDEIQKMRAIMRLTSDLHATNPE
jgi:PAS domain S-box-containing protein